MKKAWIYLLALAMALSLCACGAQPAAAPESTASAAPASASAASPGTSASLPNPVREMPAEDVLAETGIPLSAPQGASDVVYSVIDLGQDGKIAQMSFNYNDIACCLRVQSADVPKGALNDISGLYYEWSSDENAAVGYNDAELHWTEGEAGYITWYDYAPGLLYCVAMDSGATGEALVALAEAVYTPLQGDADGATASPAATPGA